MMRAVLGVAAAVFLAGCVVIDERVEDRAVAEPGSAEDGGALYFRGVDWGPTTKPPYSAIVAHDGLLHLAGTLGFTPGTRDLPDGIAAQTANALAAIEANLAQAGATKGDVIACTCYLADIGDYVAFNTAYSAVFTDNPPARTTIGVAGLPLEARVEITCVAARPDPE